MINGGLIQLDNDEYGCIVAANNSGVGQSAVPLHAVRLSHEFEHACPVPDRLLGFLSELHVDGYGLGAVSLVGQVLQCRFASEQRAGRLLAGPPDPTRHQTIEKLHRVPAYATVTTFFSTFIVQCTVVDSIYSSEFFRCVQLFDVNFFAAAVDCTNSLGRMQYAAGTPVYKTERYVTTFTCQSGYRWSDNSVGSTSRSGTCTDVGAGVGNWVVGYSCVGLSSFLLTDRIHLYHYVQFYTFAYSFVQYNV